MVNLQDLGPAGKWLWLHQGNGQMLPSPRAVPRILHDPSPGGAKKELALSLPSSEAAAFSNVLMWQREVEA